MFSMKIVRCKDTLSPRIDGKGDVTGITAGSEYQVLSEDRYFYRVINDAGKKANYQKIRFDFVRAEKLFTSQDLEDAYFEGHNDADSSIRSRGLRLADWDQSSTKKKLKFK